MKIIPAVDLLDGGVVRLTEGDYARAKSYAEASLQEIATRCAKLRIGTLHVVDLNRARGEETNVNESILIQTMSKISIRIQCGGGVRTAQKAKALLNAGVAKVIVGTAAAADPAFLQNLKESVGPDRVIVGADVRDGAIMIHGWQETAPIGLDSFIDDAMKSGYRQFLITDISRDGKLAGIDPAFYEKIAGEHRGIEIIASGGVSSMDDIRKLSGAGVSGVVVGKALYEGKITLEEIGEWNRAGG